MTTLAGHKQAARPWRGRADWRKWDRLTLFGCVTVGLIFGIAQAAGASHPSDAHMYWNTDPADLYPVVWTGGYVYAPPLALIVNALHPLGWPVFITLFTTATWAAYWYCARALALPILLLSLAIAPLIGLNVIDYLFLGNIQLFMTAAIVASIRHPAVAAFPLLTKGVGVSFVWYAVRREWRNLGTALGVTIAVVAVSFAIAPDAWFAFARFIMTNPVEASPVPLVPIALPVRLVAATVLVVWGALTDRRWPLLIAAGIGVPALYQWSFLAVWVGAIGVEWRPRSWRSPKPRSSPMESF